MTNATLRMVGTFLILAGLAVLTGAVAFPLLGDSPPLPSSSAYDIPSLSSSGSTSVAREAQADPDANAVAVDDEVGPAADGPATATDWWVPAASSSADEWCEADALCPAAV